MLDLRRWQPAISQASHPPPVEAMPLATLTQVPAPVADDFRAEPGHDLAVRRHREVREVPSDDAAEPLPLYWHGVMPTTFQGEVDRLERRPHPLWVGMARQQELTAPRL